MADASDQIGYIICGGRLLDLNSALDTSQMLKDRTNASNAIRHLQTATKNSQDNDASKCFSTSEESETSQPQGNNDDTRVSSTSSKADEIKCMKNRSCVVPDATNKSYNSITSTSTASVTSSTGERNATTASVNLPLMTRPTPYNNSDPAFSSDVIVLGKRVVAIRKLTCEEFHYVDDGDASTAAAIGRVSFTDRAPLSDNMVSNVNNSDTIPIPTINSFSPLAQKDSNLNDNGDEENNDPKPDVFSFSNTNLPLSELRLSDSIYSLNPITNSSTLNNSSPSASGSLVKFFDASGCYVIPGFIDSHMHAYQYSTPLGIKVDECCLQRGVTTAIDAGSAGAATFPGLRKFIAEKSITRVLAFVHIASHGLAAAGCSGFGKGGECDSLNQVDVDKCVSCVKENRDMVIGVKVRLAADIADNGRNEEEVYRRALEAARQADVPLMVHHAISTIPITKTGDQLSCPGDLAAGDIYTHTFHGYPSTILDPESCTIPKTVWEAKKRGVLFDVGHGQGSFNWTVLEKCAAEGFWPDTISTDLHSGNLQGPAYDLPTVMTKLLHVGMPFVEIVKAVTITPARALGISDKVGVLAPGREADITIVKIENCDAWLEDSAGQRRRIRKRIVPVAVFKGGELFETCQPVPWPNVETGKNLATQWKSQVVRDSEEPKF